MRKKIGKIQAQSGISESFREKCKDTLLLKILEYAPYITKGSEHDPHTILRDAKRAMMAVMQAILTSDICYGHSLYHESKIIENKCQYVTVMHRLYHQVLKIPLGAKVYQFPQVLSVCVTGDGGRLPKVPINTPMVPLAFMRCLGLNKYAQHSRHSGLPILLSKKSDHDFVLPKYLNKVCKNLKGEGHFCIYNENCATWFVYKYKRWDNADWSWNHKNTTNSVSPTGNYSLTGITRYNDGEFKGLLNRADKLYHCLDQGIKPNSDGFTHEQLLQNGFQGYRLTTNKVAHIWGTRVQQMWQDFVAQHPDRQYSEEYKHSKLISFATKMQVGVLGVSNVGNWCGLFDVCHAWWAWVNYILSFIIMLMWCVWQWSEDEVVLVVSCLGVEFVTTQVEKYLKENATRNPKKYIKIHTNGTILRTIIHGLHEALCQAAVIADNKRVENSENNEFVITLICVFIRITTLMRKGFATLLKDEFEWPEDDSTPPEIEEMIDAVRLATYLAYHLCYQSVSYLLCAMCITQAHTHKVIYSM